MTFGLGNDGRFYAFDVDFASPFDFPEESSLALKRFYSKRESELR